LVKRYF